MSVSSKVTPDASTSAPATPAGRAAGALVRGCVQPRTSSPRAVSRTRQPSVPPSTVRVSSRPVCGVRAADTMLPSRSAVGRSRLARPRRTDLHTIRVSQGAYWGVMYPCGWETA
ncbi:hypothetical protein C3492_07060 [Streptomyces sp. Ru62]|nr:hypothetical protein C3492_07060 [Streptomyces sp. Ru62]